MLKLYSGLEENSPVQMFIASRWNPAPRYVFGCGYDPISVGYSQLTEIEGYDRWICVRYLSPAAASENLDDSFAYTYYALTLTDNGPVFEYEDEIYIGIADFAAVMDEKPYSFQYVR